MITTQGSKTARAVYLSGPMTGIAGFNYPAFNAEAERLRAQGIKIINPAEYGEEVFQPWAEYMRCDIHLLMDCDGIHMLPGWRASKGARLEHHIATELGFAVTGAIE